jgi:hypothetical protein
MEQRSRGEGWGGERNCAILVAYILINGPYGADII